ncbi:hypothetical protein [Pedobacter foliorum]|uniref:hypothetical protein n=1 Tax=Pedobacter foliorum TaxID=2739058 RepID=UPI001566663E|nr:hypothetical protein [Pedobacter foliorum]NRF37583.1 hypothetical protein [Pedobacter foliorum]
MKLQFSKVCIVLYAMAIISCKKQEIRLTPLASIQITNALVSGSELQFGTYAATIPSNAYTAYGILAGSQVLKLSSTVAPNPLYYNQTKDFVNGGVYSLFLTGTPTAVESVFLKEENIPSHTAEVFGARVINLVTGGVAISVNLKGSAKGSFASSLAYKAISAFKDVSSLAAEGTKTFEFRNAATGDLITLFDVPDYDLPRFRNITLVFSGMVGSETIVRVNNY